MLEVFKKIRLYSSNVNEHPQIISKFSIPPRPQKIFLSYFTSLN